MRFQVKKRFVITLTCSEFVSIEDSLTHLKKKLAALRADALSETAVTNVEILRYVREIEEILREKTMGEVFEYFDSPPLDFT